MTGQFPYHVIIAHGDMYISAEDTTLIELKEVCMLEIVDHIRTMYNGDLIVVVDGEAWSVDSSGAIEHQGAE